MDAGEAAPRVLLFIVIVVGLAAVPPLLQPAPAPREPVATGATYDVFRPDRLLSAEPPAEGAVRVDADATGKLVLIDTEHGNRVSDADLAPLVAALTEAGHTVRYFDTDTAKPGGLNVALKDADAYVVIAPRERHSVTEVDAVEVFTQRGGRVLLVGQPTAAGRGPFGGRSSGVDGGLAGLADRYGITFGSGYLYNMRENANNFRSVYASPRVEDPLVDGVDRVVLREATPVHSYRASILLRAEPGTRLSTTREADQYPVLVRKGQVVALGDRTLLWPENAAVADNERLVGNLAAFLVSGTLEEVPEEEAEEEEDEQPPEEEREEATPEPTPDGDGTPSNASAGIRSLGPPIGPS